MQKLRCVVQSVVYQNDRNGFSILRVVTDDRLGVQTLLCNTLNLTKGTELECEGVWKNDPKWGLQFQADDCREVMPETLEGIEKYLGSGAIKGIGKKYAGMIVDHFGYNTLKIMDEDLDRLLEVPGIGRKKVEKIRESWDRQREIRNVMVFLHGCGVSSAYATKIYKFYGADSISKVKENPYRMADEVWGIGFKTADQIADKMGFSNEDPRRCRAGIVYTLHQLALQGHVYAQQEQLIAFAKDLLQVPEDVLTEALAVMVASDKLVLEEGAIYLPQYWEEEREVARILRRLNSTIAKKKPDSPDVEQMPDEEDEDFEGASQTIKPEDPLKDIYGPDGVKYDEVQKDAILKAIENNVMILTGGPGTGKTTTTLGIIRALQKRGFRVLLAAPTGRAA